MTVSNATSGAITQAPGNPGVLQRSHSLPSARTAQNAYRHLLPHSDSSPARITQNSPESLRAPVAGKVLFRTLEETGASSSKVRHVFDIVESGNEAGEKSYQITMSDGLRDSVTMKLEMPEGESLESVREKLKGGEFKVKIADGGDGGSVCQLIEPMGLQGGGGRDWNRSENYLRWGLKKLEQGNKSGAREDFIMALQHDDINSDAYYHLGMTLSSSESIRLDVYTSYNSWETTGIKLNQRSCFQKTMELAPENRDAYTCLKALDLKTVESEPQNPHAYMQLANTLKPGDTVRVFGENMNQQQLKAKAEEFIAKRKEAEAVAKRKEDEDYYLQLGFNLKPGTTAEVNGQHLSQQACFLKVLRLNPENDQAFVYLGTTFLRPNEKVTVNGKPMSQRDCYREALRLNPNSDLAYEHLGNTLQASGDKARIGEGLFGEKITKQACYLRAITKNPRSASAYQQLGLTMQPYDTVPVFGKNMTKQECFERAVELGGINNHLLAPAQNYLLKQTGPSLGTQKLYEEILKGEKTFEEALNTGELSQAMTNAASLWLVHQMASALHSSGRFQPQSPEIFESLPYLYQPPAHLLDVLTHEDRYIWQLLLQDAHQKGFLNRAQTDYIKDTVSIRNLQNRAERLKQAVLKTLNGTLRLLQNNQQRLAQTNRVIARQLELEREIRFYANCAAFAFADHGRQAINKQDIADTLTYIQKNLDQIPAVAEDTGRFLAEEFDECARMETGKRVMQTLSPAVIDRLSERLALTAGGIQGSTAEVMNLGSLSASLSSVGSSSAAAGPSGVQAAPSAPFIQVADEGYDSGLDQEELRYRTNANRLAFWIQKGGRHAMPRIQEIITKHPEAMHEEITRSPGREHIHSNSMDIAARNGRPDIVEMLGEGVEPMRTMKRGHYDEALLEAIEVAESNASQA